MSCSEIFPTPTMFEWWKVITERADKKSGDRIIVRKFIKIYQSCVHGKNMIKESCNTIL